MLVDFFTRLQKSANSTNWISLKHLLPNLATSEKHLIFFQHIGQLLATIWTYTLQFKCLGFMMLHFFSPAAQLAGLYSIPQVQLASRGRCQGSRGCFDRPGRSNERDARRVDVHKLQPNGTVILDWVSEQIHETIGPKTTPCSFCKW